MKNFLLLICMIMALSCTKKQPQKCHTTADFEKTNPLEKLGVTKYKAAYYTEIDCDKFLVTIKYEHCTSSHIMQYNY